MQSRRSFLAGAAGATLSAAAVKPDKNFKGVVIGLQTYSLRDRDVNEALTALKELKVQSVEMFSGHAEVFPRGTKREEIRQWRETVPISHFKDIRKKYNDGGVDIYAYNYSFREDFSEKEIARGFEFAEALGAKVITASSNVTTAKKVDPFAKKAKIRVGMHNHSRIVANEFATPDDFLAAMKGMSQYICINLDIGHFVAANFKPVEFLAEWHSRIVTLHIKDRKKDQGPNVVFGEGDTPIKDVLVWLKTNRISIPANIEYEYKAPDTVAEIRRCLAYCRAIVG